MSINKKQITVLFIVITISALYTKALDKFKSLSATLIEFDAIHTFYISIVLIFLMRYIKTFKFFYDYELHNKHKDAPIIIKWLKYITIIVLFLPIVLILGGELLILMYLESNQAILVYIGLMILFVYLGSKQEKFLAKVDH